MRCPFCKADDTQVKDSRQTHDSNSIKRRRFCPQCNSRFTTYERVELQELLVIKKDGSKRVFDRQNILKSISLATRKRYISIEQVERLVDNLVQEIEKSGEIEVSSKVIGQMIMDGLKKLDDVAYVRFASVYYDFANTGDFESFLHKMDEVKD